MFLFNYRVRFIYIITILICIHSTYLMSSDVDGELRYINSLKATIYSEPSLKSDVVVKLNRGNKVILINSNGMWSKVVFNSELSGWVYSMLLVTSEPMDAPSTSLAKGPSITNKQRSRASLYASSAAARGLSDSKEDLDGQYPPDDHALESMESVYISPIMAGDFLFNGLIYEPGISQQIDDIVEPSVDQSANVNSLKKFQGSVWILNNRVVPAGTPGAKELVRERYSTFQDNVVLLRHTIDHKETAKYKDFMLHADKVSR